MDKQFHEFLDGALTILSGLVPGAIGAGVGLLYEKGLTWGQVFAQLSIGICVSWFATRAIGALWPLDPFVLQGLSFTLGMIAFKATPRFITAAVEVVGGLPALLRDRFLPSKKDAGE